jgi:hypothetical protein
MELDIKGIMIMKYKTWIGAILLLLVNMPAYSFDSVDEQIDHYLVILETDNYANKVRMLERLQWSGLSDPRLYDEIEKQLLAQYQSDGLDKYEISLLSHRARALGFSGNEKYRSSLAQVNKAATPKRVRQHAKKALSELGKYKGWNRLIAESDINVLGKSVEVTTYMKMLNVNDTFVQRQAARAIYHEFQDDPDLLALVADSLEGLYLKAYLDKQVQDTAAWFCKALGQNAIWDYRELLTKVAEDTPHKKIRKYAKKYAQKKYAQ